MHRHIQKNEPLYMQVYEIVKNAIMEGVWEPGEKLFESKVANELQLSRSPVREAFRILEHEGLLVKRDHHIYVHQPSLEEMVELYQIRHSLEALSCSLAAENAKDEEINELQEIVQMTELALKEKKSQEIYECNTRFHEAIIYASNNKNLISIMDGLRAKTLYCRNVLVHFDYFRKDNFFSEHYQIYEAIKNRDRQKAKILMEHHISTDLERILALFPKAKIKNKKGGLKC